MRLVLVDISSLIYKHFFGRPPLLRSDGVQINAVYGVCETFWRWRQRWRQGDDRPTHIAVIFDHPSRTFRHALYSEYKAHRPPPPAGLLAQKPMVRAAIDAFGLSVIDAVGYEADDIIATYARQATDFGWTTIIHSVDKDLRQLVNESVVVHNEREIGPAEVEAEYGVPPNLLADYLALTGDASDNIPGVPGIGPARALALLKTYGGLHAILVSRDPGWPNVARKHAESALISRKLVTLVDVPVDIPLEWLTVREPDYNRLVDFLRECEFNALTQEVAAFAGV